MARRLETVFVYMYRCAYPFSLSRTLPHKNKLPHILPRSLSNTTPHAASQIASYVALFT